MARRRGATPQTHPGVPRQESGMGRVRSGGESRSRRLRAVPRARAATTRGFALGPLQARLGEFVLALELLQPRDAGRPRAVDPRAIQVAPLAQVADLRAKLLQVGGGVHGTAIEAAASASPRVLVSKFQSSRA